jgi:hypothetical protein
VLLVPMSASAELGLLGPLEVRRGGAQVRIAAPKQRALLALLALRQGHFGDDFPDEHYFLLLHNGAVTTQLYFGDSAQGSEGLSVQVAVQNYTGWLAPFVILAEPNGSHFPYPPHNGPGSDEHRKWLRHIERNLGRTLEEARLRRGVELPAKTRTR